MDNIKLPSAAEISAAFLDFLNHNNLTPKDNISIVADGNIHRFSLLNDDRGEKSGAYCIYSDNWPAGWAEDWHVGQSINWSFTTNGIPKEQQEYLDSQAFKDKVAASRKIFEQEKIQKHNAAATKSGEIFNNSDYAPENHPYLQAKHIYPYGVKINSDGTLIVPLRNIHGDIRSLQFISQDGVKRFVSESSTKGAFWAIGLDTINDNNNVILLGEGFATMAKAYELTGKPSVAGISCSALKAVAVDLRLAFPNCKIICLADNDWQTQQKSDFNQGIKAAQELLNAKLIDDFIFPTFNDNENGSDWDDFSILHGDDYSAAVLNDKIAQALIPPNIRYIQKQITSINAQELRSKIFPPVKWAVEGFLPAGLSILAGGPKIGKSILALHIALAVALGGYAFGKIKVQKGKVLYLALEDTMRRLQERINFSDMLSDSDDISNLTLITISPRQHQGGLDYINWWCQNNKEDARLVIIDTFQMFRKLLSGKGSMYAEDYEAVSKIKSSADNFNIALLMLHHLKKGMEGDWLSEISGSQGIAGAADTIFSLKRERNSNMGTLHRTGRDVEEKDFMLKLDGFGWQLLGEAEDMTMPEWKSQIIAFLKEHTSVSPLQLAQTYGININTAKSNLARLAKEGLIKKTGYGTYGLPEE